MGRRQRLSSDEGGIDYDGGGPLRWLLTYADMITLLMAFFIMLYSMSILNLNKFRQIAVSIRSGFAGLMEGQGRSMMGTSGQFSIKPSPIEGESVGVPWRAVEYIQTAIQEEHLDKLVKLRADERGLVVSLVADKVIFEKGQVDLTPSAVRILGVIADTLKRAPNQVLVEGHTCDLPIASSRYPSNWHLSSVRAANVVCYFIEEKHISAKRFTAAGYADSRPLVPNSNNTNRALNRRVDIVLLNPNYHYVGR